MKIAVNGKSFLTREKGGAVYVALRIVEYAALAGPDDEFEVFVPLESKGQEISLKLPQNVRVKAVFSPLFRGSLLKSLIWEQFALPLLVRRTGGYDLLLNLTNSAPVLVSAGVPQILLLHDIGFRCTQWFSSLFSRYLDWVVRRAGAQGVSFVTVSPSAAAEIENAYPETAPVAVIHNACDEPPSPILPKSPGYRYVLFLGSLNPRKNVSGAVEAFRIFREKAGDMFRLVIIGAQKKIFASPGTDLSTEDVIFKGYVSDTEKWSWIKGAELLLFPSFLEGFGLPVLEALKAGTPVVASRIQPFIDLFGEALEYVDPCSPRDIARGIDRVISDDRLRHDLVSRGLEVAGKFAWRETGSSYAGLFQRCALQSHKVQVIR